MIDIFTIKGEKYSFDEETERVFKDGHLLSSTVVEPIYSDSLSETTPPRFSGLFLKAQGMIISLSGKINPITDPNTII